MAHGFSRAGPPAGRAAFTGCYRRANNTGISCVIDPYGRILAKITEGQNDTFVAGVLAMDISLGSDLTFYTVHGDVFAHTVVLSTLGLFAWLIRSVRRSRPDSWKRYC